MTATYTFASSPASTDSAASVAAIGAATGGSKARNCSTVASPCTTRISEWYSRQHIRQFAQMLADSTEESDVSDPGVTRMRHLPATVVSTTLEGLSTGRTRPS